MIKVLFLLLCAGADMTTEISRAVRKDLEAAGKNTNAGNHEVAFEIAERIVRKAKQDNRVLCAVIEALQSPKVYVRFEAILILGRVGHKADRAIPDIARIIREDKKYELRTSACHSLGLIGPAALPALSELLQKAKSPDIRGHAAGAIGRLAPSCSPKCSKQIRQEAVMMLINSFADENDSVRCSAVEAIGEFGTSARRELEAGLAEKNPLVRTTAARCLIKLRSSHHKAIRVAISGVRSTRAAVKIQAIEAISDAGKHATDGIDELVNALKHRNRQVRESAALALSETFSRNLKTEALPTLIRCLSDRSDLVRGCAARTIGGFGKAGVSAVPSLALALDDQSVLVQVDVIGALGKIGKSASDAAPKLRSLLEGNSFPYPKLIRTALKKIED